MALLLEILITILLPPIGVLIETGLSLQFLLNILLTLIGYLPGLIHAIWILVKHHKELQL